MLIFGKIKERRDTKLRRAQKENAIRVGSVGFGRRAIVGSKCFPCRRPTTRSMHVEGIIHLANRTRWARLITRPPRASVLLSPDVCAAAVEAKDRKSHFGRYLQLLSEGYFAPALATLAQEFLKLNLQIARCHHHYSNRNTTNSQFTIKLAVRLIAGGPN